MSQPSDDPVPYRVVYSGQVRDGIKALVARAKTAGLGQETLRAVKQIDRLLHLYPQFGEPLRDLKAIGHTEMIGTVQPLFVRYVIDEARRTVFVVHPIEPLPHVGF